jgi:hypothetical protein
LNQPPKLFPRSDCFRATYALQLAPQAGIRPEDRRPVLSCPPCLDVAGEVRNSIVRWCSSLSVIDTLTVDAVVPLYVP